jgi:hypothetical protein
LNSDIAIDRGWVVELGVVENVEGFYAEEHGLRFGQRYVEGVRGKLKLVVEIPDRPPVVLSGLGENQGGKTSKRKARRAAKSKPETGRAP